LDPIMDPDIVAEHYHTLHHQERFSFRVVLGPNFLPVCFFVFCCFFFFAEMLRLSAWAVETHQMIPNRTRICFCYLPHIKTKIKTSAFHNQELLDATLSSCQSATLPLRRPTQAPPKIFCNHTAASFGETWKHQNQTRGRAMLSSIKCTSRVTAGSAKH
jgi:hypothetical protein